MFLSQWVDRVLDVFFPPSCLGCSTAGVMICEACLTTIPFVGEVGRPSESALDSLQAVAAYRHPIIGLLVRSFKYKRALSLRREGMEPLLSAYFASEYASVRDFQIPTMIVALPIDPERKRLRGMDHAALLASSVREQYFSKVPLVQALVRTRLTETNAHLANIEARKANVKEVFACSREVEGQDILLIDDVYTTGATLEEAARMLRENGARSVHGFVFALGGTDLYQ